MWTGTYPAKAKSYTVLGGHLHFCGWSELNSNMPLAHWLQACKRKTVASDHRQPLPGIWFNGLSQKTSHCVPSPVLRQQPSSQVCYWRCRTLRKESRQCMKSFQQNSSSSVSFPPSRSWFCHCFLLSACGAEQLEAQAGKTERKQRELDRTGRLCRKERWGAKDSPHQPKGL